MDNVGWHARRRAKKESEEAAQRAADGDFHPVEDDAEPINGFPIRHDSRPPPSLPPKGAYILPPKGETRHKEMQPMTAEPQSQFLSPYRSQASMSALQLSHMSPKERSELQRIPTMHPHLQLMVGPLLRYDTVESGVWYGAILVVTADAGSSYEPYPKISMYWDSDNRSERSTTPILDRASVDLGPHPSDPLSGSTMPSVHSSQPVDGMKTRADAQLEISGQDIYVYAGTNGTFTFWRFMIKIPLARYEMRVDYRLNSGQELNFFVPSLSQNMRWAAHSCNGFSAGVDQDLFTGPGFKNGYDPVWTDLLAKHAEKPFHVLVGGGDQLYCDLVMREPEMQEWVTEPQSNKRKKLPLTERVALAIDRFYFNHYCQAFRRGAFARANCSIPMLNISDDHDLIDGFGSYPDDLQQAPVFKHVGERAYFYYLLFQTFVNPEVDGLNERTHPYKCTIIGGPGAYISMPSHSMLSYLGPQSAILLLDTRAERRKDRICGPDEYKKAFIRLQQLPPSVIHTVVLLGVPLAYPRMVFMENALESKFNPVNIVGRTFHSNSFLNKFNAEAELLDDLNDHWTAKGHKAERNWFVQQLQLYAQDKYVRVSFVSGDVHCGAVGVLQTLAKGKSRIIDPAMDYRYMVNVVTSAIVNTPPPNPVITLVSTLATKTHRTLHYLDTDEHMMPLFTTETDGKPRKQQYIMGARNWCAIEIDGYTGDLVFDIRVEKVRGRGETVGYIVRSPPPRWSRNPPVRN